MHATRARLATIVMPLRCNVLTTVGALTTVAMSVIGQSIQSQQNFFVYVKVSATFVWDIVFF